MSEVVMFCIFEVIQILYNKVFLSLNICCLFIQVSKIYNYLLKSNLPEVIYLFVP